VMHQHSFVRRARLQHLNLILLLRSVERIEMTVQRSLDAQNFL
jgi:hypothetical protein